MTRISADISWTRVKTLTELKFFDEKESVAKDGDAFGTIIMNEIISFPKSSTVLIDVEANGGTGDPASPHIVQYNYPETIKE